MTIVQAVVAVLVAVCALATVTTRAALQQAIVFSLFGTTLALLFLVLQAPDVALSVIAVGIGYPMMILLTLGRARDRDERYPRGGGGADRRDERAVNARARVVLFLVGAAGLGALLVWAFVGLPRFGFYHGPYGNVIRAVAVSQRHATNAVDAVVFDYRGFDTVGEEFIFFAAAIGIAMLLGAQRE